MKRIFEKINRYFYGKWNLAVLDMGIGRWIVKPEPSNIVYLKAENANGRHILVQPAKELEPFYLMVDDVNWCTIQRQHQHQHRDGTCKPGRMVIETSKCNYHVWIRSSRPLSLPEKRYWLKKLNSDPGADPNNRWGRCPGFRNRKEKYQDPTGGYPLSRLTWIDWKYQADIPKLNIKIAEKILKRISPQPLEGGVCQNLIRSNYDRGDESATDFAYAIALFRKGFSENRVQQNILAERTNWKNHIGVKRRELYINRTIKRAKTIVDSNQ
jgi:hypothetical protein